MCAPTDRRHRPGAESDTRNTLLAAAAARSLCEKSFEAPRELYSSKYFDEDSTFSKKSLTLHLHLKSTSHHASDPHQHLAVCAERIHTGLAQRQG